MVRFGEVVPKRNAGLVAEVPMADFVCAVVVDGKERIVRANTLGNAEARKPASASAGTNGYAWTRQCERTP